MFGWLIAVVTKKAPLPKPISISTGLLFPNKVVKFKNESGLGGDNTHRSDCSAVRRRDFRNVELSFEILRHHCGGSVFIRAIPIMFP